MTSPLDSSHRFCVAPMIDWTDRYCRFFHRQLSRHARLYTEMIVDQAILHADVDRLLAFDATEHPVALQIGGSDPDSLSKAAKIGADYGYDEINLNVGCPSDRVQSGRFGACLMREPALVAQCLRAMREAVDIPVTVKCRIGVDDQDPHRILPQFISMVRNEGIDVIIIHARKAWLEGLSPKENRTIPPLDYDLVARMKAENRDAKIILNGGIADLHASSSWLEQVDGVMLGRAAYENPYLLAHVDRELYGAQGEIPSRLNVVAAVADKIDRDGIALWRVARHMLGLFHGEPGARRWRQQISQHGRDPGHGGAWLMALAEDIVAYKDKMTEVPS